MRVCVLCRHYRRDPPTLGRCSHPRAEPAQRTGYTDPVTGEVVPPAPAFATTQRVLRRGALAVALGLAPWACGPGGRGWEER